MSPSSTRFIGIDVHKDSRAVADVAQEHGAAVTDLGTIGTREGDIDQLIRKMPSQAKPLIVVYEAGPCGSWRDRSLPPKGYDCWVVAPSLLPKQPGDRGKTDRRDAVHRARLARSGALTAVYVPKGEEAAIRDRPRAREDTRRDLQAAKVRLKACWLRPERPRRSPSSFRHMSGPCTNRPTDSSGASTPCTTRAKRGACIRSSQPCRPCAACRAPWP